MLFKNLVIEYVDQNDEFGAFFPRKAKAVKVFKSAESSKDWLLVKLNEPFIYGQKNEFGYHMLNNTHLLISSRHQGNKICDLSFHAHVVLVPELPDKNSNEVNIEKANHVAWCVVKKSI